MDFETFPNAISNNKKGCGMYEFDHLVIAAESLDAGVAWAEERLGVSFEVGGQHLRYGTHNALLGLADGLYLEVIAIDPAGVQPEHARWFGLDQFSGAPRLITWVCRVEGLTTRPLPAGFGAVVGLTRGALSWDMAESDDGTLPFDQCHPGLIDWGATPHPVTRLAESGLRLERLTLAHPAAADLADALRPLNDKRVDIISASAPKLSARLVSTDGREIIL